MIRIYLVRHGIAVDLAERGPLGDDGRPLTEKGRRRFRRLARAFAQLGEPVDEILTSPLVRAVQTAEILAGATRRDAVSVIAELRPESAPARLVSVLAERIKGRASIALVGHDPLMTGLVALLGQLSREQSLELEFRKGSIVRIDVGGLPSARPAQVRWWMRPKTRDLIPGPPLRKRKATAAPPKPMAVNLAPTPTKGPRPGSR